MPNDHHGDAHDDDDELDVAEAAAERADDEQISHRALMAELGLDTADPNIHAVAQDLLDSLGPTLIAALVGNRDRALPRAWAREAGPSPSPAEARRLRLARTAFLRISDAEGADVARAWFILGNERLGATPLTGIREDRHADLMAAVDDFLDQPLDPVFEIPLGVLLELMRASIDDDGQGSH